jgi:hypothetical protein
MKKISMWPGSRANECLNSRNNGNRDASTSGHEPMRRQ